MAFTSLTTGEIAVGQPVSNETMDLIRTNLDDLDSRVQSLDLSSVQPPIILAVNGIYTNFVGNGILKTTLSYNIRVTGVFLLIDNAGSASTTEIDIKYSRSGGAYTSILSTLPAITYQGGNDSISSTGAYSTGAVVNPTYRDLQAGDIIRLDITSVQTGGRNFMVRIDYNKI